VTALDAMTAQFHDAKTAPHKAIAARAGHPQTLPPAVSLHLRCEAASF